MKVTAINFEPTWKDIQDNLRKKEHHIQRVLELFPETQVIVFPELSFTGYVLDADNTELAEDVGGFCVSETKKLAQKYDVHIIAWFIEKNLYGKPFNSAMVVSKKWELITTYSKNHLFSQSVEPELYSAWQELQTFELEGIKCGVFVCFDNRYPRLFEAYKKVWVECVFWMYAWLVGRNKEQIFDVIVKTRAHENQFFVVWVDSRWSDKNATYTSSACISNPFAEDIKQTKEDIYHHAQIDTQDIENISTMLPLGDAYKEVYILKNI